MKVFVIGGGSSGLVAAISAKRCGNEVTIIEKNNNVGKKLLLTGNGRCNYYNNDMSISNFNSSSNPSKIINDNNLNKLNEFYLSIGIVPRIKDGYYYPYSNNSNAFLNALKVEIRNLNINIINEEVIDIKKDNQFLIYTNNNKYTCDKVILSTGGITYPKTGSNGFGYTLLKKLGHNIITPKVALVPLKTDENVSDWKGIRANAKVSYYLDNSYIKSYTGEVQLTSYGISGICVMNLSRYFDNTKKNTLIIDFLDNIDNLDDYLDKRNKELKGRTIIELLESLINYKLLYYILKKIKIDVNSSWNDLDNNKKELLIKSIKEYKLNIIDTLDENYGEVTKGGVNLDEITDNCESVIIKGLFITGELLDIDGICGGYNLTNAFISGLLAGESND